MKRTLLLSLTVLLISTGMLSQSFPAPPAPTQNSRPDEITSAFAGNAVKTSKADKSFWEWNIPALAMNAADLAQTAQCLAAKTCVEQNPLLGANPSMPRLFGTSLPVFAAQLGFAYYMKKSNHPWRFIPAATTVTHAIAIGMSLAAR